MPEDRSERPVVRVTKADGSVVNVRKDALDVFLSENAGATAEKAPDEPTAEEEADGEKVERVTPMGRTKR